METERRDNFETASSEDCVLFKLEGFVGVFSLTPKSLTQWPVTGEQQPKKPK